MKVNLYKTFDISDAQRRTMARVLDGPGGKKRIATRDEIKDWAWKYGSDWDVELADQAPEGEAAPEPEEDLLGVDLDDLL